MEAINLRAARQTFRERNPLIRVGYTAVDADAVLKVSRMGLGGRAVVGTHGMPGRSRMTIDPRIPTVRGRRSSSDFRRPGRHLVAPSTKRGEVFGDSHEE